jgi:hypothetical protein
VARLAGMSASAAIATKSNFLGMFPLLGSSTLTAGEQRLRQLDEP